MSYPVNVRGVLETLASSREISGEIEMHDLELGEQAYSFTRPVTFDVTLTNTGAGLVASGEATTEVRTSCARCLCDVVLPVSAEVEGFYVTPGHEDGLPEEQEYEFVDAESRVDLEPAVEQSIVVALPFAPLHDPGCRGICPVCGADLNVEQCDCAPVSTGSPFEALRDLGRGGEDEPDGS